MMDEMLLDRQDGEFIRRLMAGLLKSLQNYERSNQDFVRYQFNLHARCRLWFEDQLDYITSRLGFGRKHYDEEDASKWLGFVIAHKDDFESLYSQLADQVSRDLLVEVIKFRILGMRHVRLPANNARYGQANTEIKRSISKPQSILLDNYPRVLNRYRLRDHNEILSLHGDAFTLRNTFLLEQYRYATECMAIEVMPGDVVIDGGGCWGDTALYFAGRVGDRGRVFSFEFDDQNLMVFQRNLQENEQLANRIRIVPMPIWENSGVTFHYAPGRGAATALDPGARDGKTTVTTSIDDWAQGCGTVVNFIKLDIEGAELEALRGAQWTIRRYRPALAVCLYHSMSDFVEIPRYLSNLNVGYQFYLGHVTIYHEETVLFATVLPAHGYSEQESQQ